LLPASCSSFLFFAFSSFSLLVPNPFLCVICRWVGFWEAKLDLWKKKTLGKLWSKTGKPGATATYDMISIFGTSQQMVKKLN